MSDNESSVSPSDIAIVGMALRVSGARSVDEFWSNLRHGVESIVTRTPEQLIEAGEQPDRMRRRNYVPRMAELPGLDLFDAEFFGFSPKEAAIMDPQHRQFLECTWEAFEDAARTPERMDGPIGVFAGCGMGSYFYFNVLSHRSLVDKVGMFLLRHTGNDKDFLATRASHVFDLRGPSVNVQTACSTSLVAVHYACQSLLNGECDMAAAGGVTIELPHRRGYLFQEGEVLSPDGHCRAFDHRAAGTVFGSGVGVVVLRRLADALKDGDPIRGIIKASAVNNDGASKAGYLAPSVTGQAEAIVEAQTLAGITADSIGYVECHGTGTYLGDPIEIEALTQAFRLTTDKKGFCRIGSVKTNIGHLDTAAGVASLIKATLALEREEIPANLNFEKPNPAIDFANSPFVVNDTLTAWPRGQAPRRAAINSLGVGGTNAHVIVEEAPVRARVAAAAEADTAQILVLSAKNKKSLDETGRRLSQRLASDPELALSDVAYTLLEGRKRFEHRRVVAVADRADAIAVLAQADSRRFQTHQAVPGLSGAAFLFPGGSSQYPGMARTLYDEEPTFRAVVEEGLSYLPEADAKEIREIWLQPNGPVADAAERFLKPVRQLPAILCVEVGLVRLLREWGISPTAMIGHSMGEYTAAHVAGVMDFETAVKLVHLRGALIDELPTGGILSVPLSADAIASRLPAALDLASVNAPELCVVSGPNDALDSFKAELDREGIEANRLPLAIAAHSRVMDAILGRLEAFLRQVKLAAPTIPIASNLTGKWLTAEEARDPKYWTQHLRRTVRFADGMALLAADPNRVYIEVGPGRGLSSLAKAQGSIAPNQIINCLPHPDEGANERLSLLTSVGRALAVGLPVNLEPMWQGTKPRRVVLPTYAFQHQPYFLEQIEGTGVQAAQPLFQKLPDMAAWGYRPSWRQSVPDVRLGAERTPTSWLVFLDDAGTCDSLVIRLRAQGHKVITVALGDAFGLIDEDAYVLCPEHGREGYDALIGHLASIGSVPQRIIHAWLLTADESFRPGSNFFNRNQERGFYSLFYLAQALSNVSAAAPMQLTVLTNGMERVGDEGLPYPEKATVLGPVQVLPREMPGTFVRVIDMPVAPAPNRTTLVERGLQAVLRLQQTLAVPPAKDDFTQRLWEDIFAELGNEIVAYRDGRRWRRDWEPLALTNAAEGAARFRHKGVYVITGGLGDMASVCALELASRFAARLVLIGRAELPDRAQWPGYLAAYGDSDRIGKAIATINRIEAAGGEVFYARADITNPEALRQAMGLAKARFGSINGVLHAAGVVKDELIAMKSPSDVEAVFAPKLLGTMVLSDVLKDEPLDLVVLFSSTSTDIAPTGQIDYVGANAYLNAVAESRAHTSQPLTVAVHWGIWNEVGLAARAIRQAEMNEPVITAQPARQPLFDRKVNHADTGDRLEARWAPGTHWLLDEHRLKSGHALWPGTGYIEVIAEALREFGINGPFAIEDLTFLRPLYVPDSDARTVRVSMKRDDRSWTLSIESEVDTPKGPGLLQHVEATAQPLRAMSPPRLDITALRQRCTARTLDGAGQTLRSVQDEHVRFGPRWQVLREAHFGKAEAVARLALRAEFSDDIAAGMLVHPALLDIATGYAMDLIPGYDAVAGLWVPMSYGRIRAYKVLPPSVWSWVRLNEAANPGPGFATFDITITDEQGHVVLEVDRFTVTKLGRGTDFTTALASVADARVDTTAGKAAAAELSPAMAKLAAQVEQGINANEGFEALLRAVGAGQPQVVVSSMALPLLQQAAAMTETAQESGASFERPDLGNEFVEPSSDIERTLAGFWSELLGIQKIGVNDSFFDIGGHSLIAVRLFRMIKKTFAVDFPISVLFEAPTIAQCAALIERSGGKTAGGAASGSPVPVAPEAANDQPQFLHLVRINSGKDPTKTPFFVCAGMFGNILNLRYLAVQVGQDRPVYGIQARGLYGEQAPHETFEDMAADYLKEVRAVQPHGPYLLGGYSGGGLVAYEMAQQLRAAGEETAQVVMLDTPYPADVRLSVPDLVSMKWQDLSREGVSFFGKWARNRIAWEIERYRKRKGAPTRSAEQFHNEEIEAAFRRALGRYKGKPYSGSVVNLRPRLKVTYTLRDGRLLNFERDLLRSDNGWTPLVEDLTIIEVSGDHDSMVLEPNVRVACGHVREALNQAEMGAPQRLAAE